MATKSLGEMVDEMQALRAKKRALEQQVKAIEEEYDQVEVALLASMDKQGLEKLSGRLATATVSESDKPRIIDDTKFFAFLTKTKSYFLFERRISSAAFRDTVAARSGKPIPGIESFTKRSISLRDISN